MVTATLIDQITGATGAIRPVLAPGGDLLYVTDRTGTMQLWHRPRHLGVESQLTRADRVGPHAVSADGALVAFAADTEGSQHWALWVMRADGSDARPLSDVAGRVHHLVGWSPDLDEVVAWANLRDRRFFDLFAFPLAGGPPRPVFVHDGSGLNAAVLSDGGVVVSVHRDRMQHHHLIHVDRGGNRRLLTPDDPPAMHEKPRPHGRGVLVLSNRGREFIGVASVGLDGSYEPLVTPDHEIQSLAVNGDRWAYELNREGLAEIHVVDGTDRVISGYPPGALLSEVIDEPLSVGDDGSVAFSLRRYDQPPAIYVAEPGGDAELTVAPSMEGIDPAVLPVAEAVSWSSFDGLRVRGFLLRPRAGGTRPTVVDLHGGTGQSRPRWFPWTVSLVAHGFNVLCANVRGSSGYGRTYQFLDQLHKRMDSVRDLDATAEWLVREGIAPAGEIGIMGSSYGGFMTLAAIAFYPSRWAAAVNMFGISDHVAHLESLPPWRRRLRETEFGSLDHDRDLLASISPINVVDSITTPLMVVHGTNDSLVLVSQSQRIVDALRDLGRDVTFIQYEDEGHMIHRAENLADLVPRMVDFFERCLGP